MQVDPSARPTKVVVVGDAGVGKTCIINRAIRRCFLDDSSPTIGTGFEKLVISDIAKPITFEIWDTAGQERYRSLTPHFFKQASAAVFVFDLTNADSLSPLDFYLQAIRETCPERSVVVSLVGNKTDLEEERRVGLDLAMAVKENIGAQFYRECSAKAGAGVLEIFKDIALAPNLRLTATTERIESTLSWGSDKKSCC